MRPSLLALALLAGTSVALARPTPKTSPRPPKVEIANSFGFDALNPERSTCGKVAGPLRKKLAAYACERLPAGTTASGRSALAECISKNGLSHFVLFTVEADCNAERDTQLANAP